MKLTHLLKDQPYDASRLIDDVHVNAINTDSRQVRPDSLFIALKPLDKRDVRPYILDAVSRGATYILKDQDVQLAESELTAYQNVTFIDVKNTRLTRALIAANLYPRTPENLIAVTGTNGKSSVVTFLRQIFGLCGINAASIGTIGVQTTVPDLSFTSTSLTSPDPFILHQIMDKLAESKITHAAFEASSHGLDQHRIDGLDITVAAFTNLSHEHLDYHGTIDQYLSAKLRLFSELLPEGQTAVLNADDLHYKTLYDICHKRGHQIISFGRQGQEITLIDATMTPQGQVLKLKIYDKNYTINAPLISLVQGYNIMTAIGLALGCGLDIDKIIAVIPKLESVPGRFERIGQHPSGGMVYVDYAHKPVALESVLTSLRPHFKGLLTVVFGCGGDRDTQKRPIMGKIAAEYADIVFVTDDNPRSENPVSIRQQIMDGCLVANEIGDRHEAINQAIKQLGTNDACVIAGKGNEQNQIIGDQILPFDDRDVARQVLIELGGTVFD